MIGVFSRRPETPAQDQARTGRLLDALDQAAEAADPNQPLTPFEDVLLEGLGCGPACSDGPYPPAGHTYPKRG